MGKSRTPAKTKGGVPSTDLYDFGEEHEGGGFEGQSRDDQLIPFIEIIQALTPPEKKKKGDVEGTLFNTATEERYPDGVVFVPCGTEQKFVEWRHRDDGGGFKGIHEITSEVVRAARAASGGSLKLTVKRETDSGGVAVHQLMQTFYVYGLTFNEAGEPFPVVLAFASSKIKRYRKWNTKLKTVLVNTPRGRKNPPLYSHAVRVKTVPDDNDQGNWMTFDMTPLNGTIENSIMKTDDPRFEAAMKFSQDFAAGEAGRPNYATSTSEGDEAPAPF